MIHPLPPGPQHRHGDLSGRTFSCKMGLSFLAGNNMIGRKLKSNTEPVLTDLAFRFFKLSRCLFFDRSAKSFPHINLTKDLPFFLLPGATGLCLE